MKLTLKAARVNVGLSQKDAALAIGVTKDTISNWERRKSFPNAEFLERIQKVYKIPYDSINFLPQNNALSVKTVKQDVQPFSERQVKTCQI